MHVLVGLDLRPNGRGALRFAVWLREQLGAELRTDGLHVVERLEETFAARLGLHPTAEIVALTEHAVRSALAEEGVAGAFTSIEVMPATTAEDLLAHEALVRTADLLVVGRRARSESRMPMRLGRVARRLLRSLPVVVVVAPPDLRVHEIGSGPLLAATDGHAWSVDAARFTDALAGRLHRPWWLVHVARPLEDYGSSFLPAPAREGAHRAYVTSTGDSIHAWAAEHGLRPDRIEIDEGSPADRIAAIATRVGAPLVVAGSRRLGWQERIFRPSVADDLAGHAAAAVAVVPSQDIPA